jgi:hypothetical protein
MSYPVPMAGNRGGHPTNRAPAAAADRLPSLFSAC